MTMIIPIPTTYFTGLSSVVSVCDSCANAEIGTKNSNRIMANFTDSLSYSVILGIRKEFRI